METQSTFDQRLNACSIELPHPVTHSVTCKN